MGEWRLFEVRRMTVMIVRPEIKGGILRALEMLANERSNEVHKVTPTQLVNDLVFEEWNRKHFGMMFPDVNGGVIRMECTPLSLNT